jgi:acetyl esterase/lipase
MAAVWRWRRCCACDMCVSRAGLLTMAQGYLQRSDPYTPLASPLFGDLHGLPPLLVVAGGDETLLDDALGVARAAPMAEVDPTIVVGGGMQHIYPIYAGAMAEADAGISLIGQWIRASTSAESSRTGASPCD